MAQQANQIRGEKTVTLAPGATIGILGGGQLGRMLSMAAIRMGYHTHVYSDDPDSPAFEVATAYTLADYDDAAMLKEFAASVDVITYEFENIPAAPLKIIAKKILPGLEILSLSQHRVKEKQALQKLGIKTAPFAAVSNKADLEKAVKKIGLPAVLKTSTMGYDGKGQWMLKNTLHVARCTLQDEMILEGFVDFVMEISVIVARDAKGNIACYPAVKNTHKNHILHETIAPAPISPALSKKAEKIARTIAKGLKLVGILAVEMFVTKKGEILVNELAPRPHNSGHWTMDACATSQFEQTVRAICGLKLGSTKILNKARMLNLIGDDIKGWEKYLKQPNARLHIYGKKESRPGRKMGHVTFI